MSKVTQQHRDAEHVCIVEALTERDNAREDCAKIADRRAAYHAELGNAAVSNECRYIAARIREADGE